MTESAPTPPLRAASLSRRWVGAMLVVWGGILLVVMVGMILQWPRARLLDLFDWARVWDFMALFALLSYAIAALSVGLCYTNGKLALKRVAALLLIAATVAAAIDFLAVGWAPLQIYLLVPALTVLVLELRVTK